MEMRRAQKLKENEYLDCFFRYDYYLKFCNPLLLLLSHRGVPL